LFCTGILKIVHPPVGSELLETARSRWLLPLFAGVVPTWSRVRMLRKNRPVATS